ncbi:unnamed protein product [Coccothraustes coccothraustes]
MAAERRGKRGGRPARCFGSNAHLRDGGRPAAAGREGRDRRAASTGVSGRRPLAEGTEEPRPCGRPSPRAAARAPGRRLGAQLGGTRVPSAASRRETSPRLLAARREL